MIDCAGRKGVSIMLIFVSLSLAYLAGMIGWTVYGLRKS